MATTPSSTNEFSQEDTHVTLQVSDILSDEEEDLTFSQLISRYNDASMFTSSMLDDSSFEDTSSYHSNINDDHIYTQGRDDINMAGDGNTETKITQNLRTYLEKECFPETEWSSELLFNASTDRTNFQLIDITKYVGNSQFKRPKDGDNFRVYFDTKDYPIEEEFETMDKFTTETTMKQKVQMKFKSQPYINLCKDLREASGKCGFHIVQNGNQKIDLKKNGLRIRNRFSCQRYSVYKGSKKDITGNREYRRYTLHNDRKNQRSQGRKKCRRSYSSKSVTKDCRCKFFFYIDFDEHGFFVEPGIGNWNHTDHPPLNRNSPEKRKDQIDDNDKSLIDDMADGQAKDAQI